MNNFSLEILYIVTKLNKRYKWLFIKAMLFYRDFPPWTEKPITRKLQYMLLNFSHRAFIIAKMSKQMLTLLWTSLNYVSFNIGSKPELCIHLFWTERVVCATLGCWRQNSVATINNAVFSLSPWVYFLPEKGYEILHKDFTHTHKKNRFGKENNWGFFCRCWWGAKWGPPSAPT